MDEGTPEDAVPGISLALLVLIALLLAGNLSALLRLRAPARPEAGAVAPPPPASQAQVHEDGTFPEIQDLLLHDLVLGIVQLQEEDRLALTPEQKLCLLALEPDVRDLFGRNVRAPGPVDARLRDCLTRAQHVALFEYWNRVRPQPADDLRPLADRFRQALSRP